VAEATTEQQDRTTASSVGTILEAYSGNPKEMEGSRRTFADAANSLLSTGSRRRRSGNGSPDTLICWR